MCCRWNIQIEMKKTLIWEVLVRRGTRNTQILRGITVDNTHQCEPTPRRREDRTSAQPLARRS